MKGQKLLRVLLIVGGVAVVSFLHYETTTSDLWLHQIFQRAYYLPILLAALWFGWRGGLLSAALAGTSYVPHILMAWKSEPAYRDSQLAEIVMYFAVGALTGVLADQERGERRRVEETAKKLSEVYRQLQESFEQVRRADRLAALGQLSAGLAHEIRNPLGSIEGAVGILGRPELPEKTRQEFTTLAQSEVNRLKNLVAHFLDFARPQQPQRLPTNLANLFASVKALATETAKMGGVQLRLEAPDDLSLRLDPEQITQVLLNLVLNAIEAMPHGGEVVLRAASTADSICIAVQDEGVGISEENLERIFDPFFTTRANGTGLGLSIAYGIVSQHGGHIEARRNPDQGMTFTVALPGATDRERARARFA